MDYGRVVILRGPRVVAWLGLDEMSITCGLCTHRFRRLRQRERGHFLNSTMFLPVAHGRLGDTKRIEDN